MVLCIEVGRVVGHTQQANAALVRKQRNSHPGTVLSKYQLRICAQLLPNNLRKSVIHRQIVNNERFAQLTNLSVHGLLLKKPCQSLHYGRRKDTLVGQRDGEVLLDIVKNGTTILYDRLELRQDRIQQRLSFERRSNDVRDLQQQREFSRSLL